MISFRGLDRASQFHCVWALIRCGKRNPRATVIVTIFSILFLLFFCPGYEPIYGPCQLSLSDELHTGASNLQFGHLTLDFGREIHLRLLSSSDLLNSSTSHVGGSSVKLSAVIGRNLVSHAPYRLTIKPNQLNVVFPESGVRLDVFRSDDICYRITWESCSGHLRDSIGLSGAHWYGGPTVFKPHWPVSELHRPSLEAVVTGDVYKDYYGGVVERFWISSNGASLHVDYNVPLFMSMNSNHDGNMDIEARFA